MAEPPAVSSPLDRGMLRVLTRRVDTDEGDPRGGIQLPGGLVSLPLMPEPVMGGQP